MDIKIKPCTLLKRALTLKALSKTYFRTLSYY